MDRHHSCFRSVSYDKAAAAIIDVLAQLPADVVDSQVWEQLDRESRRSFALASPAGAHLFRATRQALQLRGSLPEPQLAAAALELYVACTTLRIDLQPADDAQQAQATSARWESILAVLLRLTPRARSRYHTVGVCGLDGAVGIGFTASLAACFPRVRELKLGALDEDSSLDGLPAGVGALLPLAALPHLSTLTAAFHGEVSVASLDADLAHLTCLAQLTQLTVEAAVTDPDTVSPNLTPLSALRCLADLSVRLLYAASASALFDPLVEALPPNLRRLSLGGDGLLGASLDAAACDAVGRLTCLEELVVGRLQPRPRAVSGRLPPTVRRLTFPWTCTSELPALVPALELLGTDTTVTLSVYADGPAAPAQLRLLHGPAARLGGLSLCFDTLYDHGLGLAGAVEAELHLLGPALYDLKLHMQVPGSTPGDVQAAERLGQHLAACKGLKVKLNTHAPRVVCILQFALAFLRVRQTAAESQAVHIWLKKGLLGCTMARVALFPKLWDHWLCVSPLYNLSPHLSRSLTATIYIL